MLLICGTEVCLEHVVFKDTMYVQSVYYLVSYRVHILREGRGRRDEGEGKGYHKVVDVCL